LDAGQRRLLSQRLFAHVAGVLHDSPDIAAVALLSDEPLEGWDGRFFLDEGRGLNAELDAAAAALGRGSMLVIHADLPLLAAEDIAVLLAQAADGCALAPDRAGSGTNAVALHDPSGFMFGFGPGSFARHLVAAQGRARVVERIGLGLDIDVPEDLDAAIALGGKFLPD
jgi:2-phospho-L-lactate guanylyltransferase